MLHTSLAPIYSISEVDTYHRHEVAQDFRAARESMQTVRRMLSLVSSRRTTTDTAQCVAPVPAHH